VIGISHFNEGKFSRPQAESIGCCWHHPYRPLEAQRIWIYQLTFFVNLSTQQPSLCHNAVHDYTARLCIEDAFQVGCERLWASIDNPVEFYAPDRAADAQVCKDGGQITIQITTYGTLPDSGWVNNGLVELKIDRCSLSMSG